MINWASSKLKPFVLPKAAKEKVKKTTHRMGDDVSRHISGEALTFRIYKEHLQLK